jgi:aconitate hydratase
VCAVLSGNRNFPGRVHPLVQYAYLASPPLVVAYAIAGTVLLDLSRDSLGKDRDGRPVTLSDIWPSEEEIATIASSSIKAEFFTERYENVTLGDQTWQGIEASQSALFHWDPKSTHLCAPPYVGDAWHATHRCEDLRGARALVMLGDGVSTDHISPVGPVPKKSAAGEYLAGLGVREEALGTYLARRVNHDVMARGTFTNAHLANELCPGLAGGCTRHFPGGEVLPIYEAAVRYAKEKTPVVVLAGRDYGVGSSRDWAAKGPALLGVRAVIAESFERIHRSNLVGMGILPLQFPPGISHRSLGLNGSETLDIFGIESSLAPGAILRCVIRRTDNTTTEVALRCRVDTKRELSWLQSGGILNHTLHLFKTGGAPL